ncbi:MAG: response regulator [Acetatifactor sp.]|nr:response regulator [Acetatifactor sp.]MDE7044911.1 response regulator [Acetatifactor sp.]
MDYEHNENCDSVILIVDDVEMNRVILEEIIKDMGCRPVLAENGVQALEEFKRCNPDLVLTDVSMPEMDGHELCRILKSRAHTRDVPVIFISAFGESEDVVKGFSLGGNDYIVKPFIPEVVQARVKLHLSLHAATLKISENNRRLQKSVQEQVRQIEQERKNVLYALANMAAEKSFYSHEHIERLQKNCRKLAQSMQFSPLFAEYISDTYIDTIEAAAALCDIGNISIPQYILQKESALDEEETKLVQSHPEVGAKLLKDLHVTTDFNDFVRISVDVVNYHHENWDGSGYPEQLKGENIPLAARIVAVADVYSALTERRSYRDAFDKESALQIMQKESGKKFHPEIFQIFCKIARQLC